MADKTFSCNLFGVHVLLVNILTRTTNGMKIARVIPLFKNGNINDFTNYRLISLLSQFSKILGNIFHNRMMSFIEEKSIMGPFKCYVTQMGVGGCQIFRKKRYECVRFNVISVTRGWVGVQFPEKKRYVTLEWPLCMKVNMGLEKNMSTSLAILELVENITTSIDDCKSNVDIFIDLKKAIDTVDHRVFPRNNKVRAHVTEI